MASVSRAGLAPASRAKLGARVPALGHEDRGRHGAGRQEGGRAARLDVVEVAADHLEPQEVVALHREDEAQAVDIGRRELAVARLGARGRHEPLLLEEPQLRGGEIGEVWAELGEHLPDAEQTASPRGAGRSGRRPRRHHALVLRSTRDA